MSKKRKKKSNIAVALLSGGMDSTVATAIAKEMGFEIAALHVNYGQRTERKELKQFHELCKHFETSVKLVVDIDYLINIGKSSLTDENMDISKADLENDDIPSSYVPFRNANMLSIAASWAESLGSQAIYIGAVAEDSSGYPDTRQTFFDAFQLAIRAGTKPDSNITIYTPVINRTKDKIIQMGKNLNVPFEKTWSCYKDDDIACGECDACALRLRAFEKLGIEDPLEYKVRPSYLKKKISD